MGKQKADILTLFGEDIFPGESRELNFSIAKLHSLTPVEVPVIVERSMYKGPTVLFTAGIHGDEVNGVEIIRQIISKGINKPKIGTVICIPVINIFGFIHKVREFPDGRDLNRSFPGSKRGSLAARVAYKLMNEIIPHVDFCLDFHSGNSDRFNAPQIRIEKNNELLLKLSKEFNAPFVLMSNNLNKTFRMSCKKKGVPMLLFEGGKSNYIDSIVSNTGVNGSKRVLHHLGMLRGSFKVTKPKKASIVISQSKWLRAHKSGMFKHKVRLGTYVEKGQVIGHLTDPYGKINYSFKSSYSGYIINVNESPLVYQGDALFHISSQLK